MKKNLFITCLILIITVSVAALVVSWQKDDIASQNPNLIKCENHIDLNLDMVCDNCAKKLFDKSEIKEFEIESENKDGTITKIAGNMPIKSKVESKVITKEKATSLAIKNDLNLTANNIVCAYDLSINADDFKYQPEEYNNEVSVSISNLDIKINPEKKYALLHILDDGSFETVDIKEITENEIKFIAKSFSTYILIEVDSYNISFAQDSSFVVKDSVNLTISSTRKYTEATNFRFYVKPLEGYVIKNENGEERNNLLEENAYGDYNITLITENLVVDIEVVEEECMITEWTIPADNTPILLPAHGNGINLIVDWGDGSPLETVTTAFAPHTYANAGVYDIKIIGTCESWGYKEYGNPSSNYVSYTQYLTKVKQFGELGVTYYGFSNCANLEYVTNLVSQNTFVNVTSMQGMFCKCTKLTNLDISNYNTSEVTTMKDMFVGCQNLETLIIGDIDTSKVSSMESMFNGCSKLTTLDIRGLDTENVSTMLSMFKGCKGLTSLDLSGFNTANVKNMQEMFNGCSGLTSLDLSGFNTANVSNMKGMFEGCSGLISLDLSNFNTAKVTTMEDMFDSCTLLKELDLSSFNTSKVTNMHDMFANCTSLENVNLSSFDTSSVTTMAAMFWKCSSLKKLDVTNFNTEKVTAMGGMFEGCSSLKILDLSSFDTQNASDANEIFFAESDKMMYGCDNLKSILISEKFVISGDTAQMFDRCKNLSSIVTTSKTPVENQFNQMLPDNVTLYVPNGSEEAYAEALSGDIGQATLAPVVQVVGGNNQSVGLGKEYEENGYTIGGFTPEEIEELTSNNNGLFGYEVTVSGSVNGGTEGNYEAGR